MPGEVSFDDLVARFQDRVFRLAARFFPRAEDAEEVTQDVFLKVHRSLPSYRHEAPLEHWILRIATNTCRDRLRARKRSPEGRLLDPPSLRLARGGSSGASPENEWLEAALRGRALREAEAAAARFVAARLLDRLPPRDRIVLVLMDLEGRSSEEIAAITGSSRAAVKVRASRARRRLRRLAAAGAGGRGDDDPV